MEGRLQGAGQSELYWDAQRLVITLPRQALGRLWAALVERLTELRQARTCWRWTQPTMTARGPGPDAPRWQSQPLDVLSGLLFWLKVPAQHELVRLWQVIDWAQINALCAPLYQNAHGGRLAWAPAQLLALLVLMFLYGVAHETTLLQRVQENLVWCWFCGFGLFGPWPDHSTLYTFRQRVGVARFEQVLTLAVQACLAAGLVRNELVHFDLTPVVASGHRWTPYERAVVLSKALLRYLELVWAAQQPQEPFPEALRRLAATVALETLPHKALQQVAPERVLESVAHWAQQAGPEVPPWQNTLEAAVQEQLPAAAAPSLPASPAEHAPPWLVGVAKELLARLPHTRGDADARVGRTTNYTWFCGYLLGFIVDGYRHVITAVTWATGQTKQALLFRPALHQHLQRVPGKPQGAGLDSAFDHPEVYSCLDGENIVGHIASRKHTQPSGGGWGTDRLRWDEHGTLCCPHGPLRAVGQPRPAGQQLFVGTACAQCGHYAQCSPQGQGQAKQFNVHPAHHRRWQQNREHNQTAAYKAAQKARFVEEGRFGLAKMNHGAGRAPYRSEEMNHQAGLLIATVMNWRILARRRPAARSA
jgi:transposase